MLNFSWSDLWWPWIWPIGSNTHLNSLWFILNAFNLTVRTQADNPKINKWIFIWMIFRKLVISVKIMKIVYIGWDFEILKKNSEIYPTFEFDDFDLKMAIVKLKIRLKNSSYSWIWSEPIGIWNIFGNVRQK